LKIKIEILLLKIKIMYNLTLYYKLKLFCLRASFRSLAWQATDFSEFLAFPKRIN
jgi:hypothetical protein